jgi:hypothetical protein
MERLMVVAGLGGGGEETYKNGQGRYGLSPSSNLGKARANRVQLIKVLTF